NQGLSVMVVVILSRPLPIDAQCVSVIPRNGHHLDRHIGRNLFMEPICDAKEETADNPLLLSVRQSGAEDVRPVLRDKTFTVGAQAADDNLGDLVREGAVTLDGLLGVRESALQGSVHAIAVNLAHLKVPNEEPERLVGGLGLSRGSGAPVAHPRQHLIDVDRATRSALASEPVPSRTALLAVGHRPARGAHGFDNPLVRIQALLLENATSLAVQV